jgi:hypothetical protein
MQFSPCGSQSHRNLYRNGRFAVTLAAAIWLAIVPLAAQILTQYARKGNVDKGPRALGLVQLAPSGKKGRLIPIAIMLDGKFFDAGSYKASPVPMALDFDTVYEAFRTGVSQGVFTITQPGQLNHVWIAEGTWLPAGMVDPKKAKKYSTPVIADDDKDGPPVLHRRAGKSDSDSESDGKNAEKSKDDKSKDDKSKDEQKPSTPASTATGTSSTAPASTAPASGGTSGTSTAGTTPSTTASGSAPPASDSAKAPATTPSDAAKTPAPPATAKAPSDDETIQDPNRPRLRRGKPESTEHREAYTTFDAAIYSPAAPMNGKTDAKQPLDAVPAPVLIPAISDAGGPDPRPYLYELKPVEEAIYRNKMLELAAQQLHSSKGAAAKDAATPRKTAAGKSGAKAAKPDFDYVSLHIFDLSNSNEPVLVLSAKTHPADPGAKGSIEEPKEITLIARTNLEGDLQKLFFSETDSRHLYSSPRMELIDAVDADGDGRGELLFRRTFDDGSAYAIYRVTADGLWPLFEGTP